ncbi:MAG: hypothetical protein BMS9Abin02_0100 [Anaerolineae bacterium]|nr:MAG: hypothetical protein BMS9Abin02_0100 [Anaerolineae bacterium]
MVLKRTFVLGRLLILALIIVLLLVPEWPAFQDERFKIGTILGQRYFDFLTWGVQAIATKSEAQLTSGDRYLNDEQQKDFVLDYLNQLENVRRLEAQINGIFADPELDDPAHEASDLQQEVDVLRADLSMKQQIAESILQNQISSVLNEEGFNVLGYTWPPVLFQMTPLPLVLIVSPREEIKQIYNIPLDHGLSTSIREDIESGIYEAADLSALVAPIGGLGFYPAMIVETNDINFLSNTIAHEWAHHWLTLKPLGINIFSNNELLTINETAASIVGNEIGRKVLERYYPEFIPADEPESGEEEDDGSDPLRFDFNKEMRTTRIKVDELLAEGRVENAEAYMEERRLFFWENGHRLRKLNQAFFAFYGSYADEPGEQGDDPIGPTILAIREGSSSLFEFLDRLSSVTSIDDLNEIAAGIGTS